MTIFPFAGITTAMLLLGVLDAQQPQDSYVLGPDDQVSVSVRDAKEIEFKPARIDAAGNLELHYVGSLQAAGLSTGELAKAINERLKNFMKDPKVEVEVTEYGSQPVSVVGAVSKPGVYQLRGRKTLIEVLSLAEGLRNDAGHRITITRQTKWGTIPLPAVVGGAERPFSAQVNAAAIMDARAPEANILIKPHDIIAVSRAEMVYVVGSVRRSGGFVLGERESITVLQAIALAEGLDRTAAGRNSRIVRTTEAGSKRVEIPVNVVKILANKEPDRRLEANDVLFIPNSAMKSAGLRSAEAAIQLATGVVIWRR